MACTSAARSAISAPSSTRNSSYAEPVVYRGKHKGKSSPQRASAASPSLGSGKRKGNYIVALFRPEFAVTARGDDQVLFTFPRVRHRGCLRRRGQFVVPQLLAGVRVERV